MVCRRGPRSHPAAHGATQEGGKRQGTRDKEEQGKTAQGGWGKEAGGPFLAPILFFLRST